MGPEVGPHYDEQANRSLAGNLTGRLLLVHGEMDENVHPASTLALSPRSLSRTRTSTC